MSQYEVYEEEDAILPALNLPNPCGIRIEIQRDVIKLFIGPRDWSWNRKTGIMNGCGTQLPDSLPDVEEP